MESTTTTERLVYDSPTGCFEQRPNVRLGQRAGPLGRADHEHPVAIDERRVHFLGNDFEVAVARRHTKRHARLKTQLVTQDPRHYHAARRIDGDCMGLCHGETVPYGLVEGGLVWVRPLPGPVSQYKHLLAARDAA